MDRADRASRGERSDRDRAADTDVDGPAAVVEALAAEPPVADAAAATFEMASAHDRAQHPRAAEHLYHRALELGLRGRRRSMATIQLAELIRRTGRPHEAVRLLSDQATDDPDDGLGDARAAFLALALADIGWYADALGAALTALADHLPRYQTQIRSHLNDNATEVPLSSVGG